MTRPTSAASSTARPTFQTRTATDAAGELSRRQSLLIVPDTDTFDEPQMDGGGETRDVSGSSGNSSSGFGSLTRRLFHRKSDDLEGGERQPLLRKRSHSNGRSISGQGSYGSNDDAEHKAFKPGLGPRPVGGHEKLSTFSGVFVPTCLNVLSILMFLRFGFILGQAGVIGIMVMLVAAYAIDFITIFSLSAIASNGTVRGGGAYYLISRSLGPEFGGSIGLVFYLGLVFNTSLNAMGLIDAFQNNFGTRSGNWAQVLPESVWFNYLWATVVLMTCTAICLAGSAVFARASNGLLVVLLIATFSIPFSALVMQPFEDRNLGINYTGLSMATFKANLWPRLTKGAAGSQMKGKETFQDLFGILFPATSGIFAGASMSGDLKTPSKSIPKGTLWALLLTFVSYTLVIFAMASTTTRLSFVNNINIIQDTNVSGALVLAGEFATTFFSTLMGVIGAAKLLQALARDQLFPGLAVFGQGTKRADEPVYAIFATYLVAQAIMLFDINQIAGFITMTYLMTFLVMNLATFLLKIGSAPNFRPSFHFFSWQTALAGSIVSGTAMFFVDGLYASACVAILMMLFLLVHYTSKPRSWGDVSQSLIYHQVRKYLLRLKPEHVKFWRPQILLFVNDPRRQYKLIQFCNSMKKGSLYILGHVIVSNDFSTAVPEARRQQAAWSKYIDFSKIKAFVNITVSPGFEWGARNLALSAGLGGMRPNIAVLGFYNMDDMQLQKTNSQERAMTDSAPTLKAEESNLDRNGKLPDDKNDAKGDELPTDSCKTETTTSVTSYVTILEDLLLRLQINVAVARGFQNLEIPKPDGINGKKYIDLWPIQMSAEIVTEGAIKANLLTTNFDTYTLILQLGCILHTVPSWKKSYKLRVCVFVEYESDVEDERARVKALLENLRIEAKILVFWLAKGNLPAYEIIVNGNAPSAEALEEVEDCLAGQEWWEEIQRIRGNRGDPSPEEEATMENVLGSSIWPEASFQQGPRHEKVERFLGLRKLLHRTKRRRTMSEFGKLGVQLGMRAQRLPPQLARYDGSQADGHESSDSELSDRGDSGSISAASEGDAVDLAEDSDGDVLQRSPTKIARRRSHGDTLRGPKPSKTAAGEREAVVPDTPVKKRPIIEQSISTPARSLRDSSGVGSSTASSSKLHSRKMSAEDAQLMPPPPAPAPGSTTIQPSTSRTSIRTPTPDPSDPTKKLESRFASLRCPASSGKPTQNRLSAPSDERPILSRHASTQKFSSKPVPVTQVAEREGGDRSIMFIETPSPPPRRAHRLPSAYVFDGPSASASHSQSTSSDDPASSSNAAEQVEKAGRERPRGERRGSTYSTQSLPLSFNDLPCRAQHLILNQLMRSQSGKTAVLFTTLPAPVEGTAGSEERCWAYLNDLEVLTGNNGKGGRGEGGGGGSGEGGGEGTTPGGVGLPDMPPTMLVHSNSMTVTMSL